MEDRTVPSVPKATDPLADTISLNAVDTTDLVSMRADAPSRSIGIGSVTEQIVVQPPWTIPCQQTSFFRDSYPAEPSPGSNWLQEDTLSMNLQWTGQAEGPLADQIDGNLEDAPQQQQHQQQRSTLQQQQYQQQHVKTPLNEQLRDRWNTVNRGIHFGSSCAATVESSLPPPSIAAAQQQPRDVIAEFLGFDAFGAQGQER